MNIPKPPGYQPGQTRAPLIHDIAAPLAAISVTLACLRFYVRACIVKVVGKDDWLLLAGVIFLWIYVGSTLYRITLGLGKHEYDLIRENDPRKLVPFSFLAVAAYYLSQCCVQCSILAFYLRIGIADISGRRMTWIIYSLMGFSILNNASGVTLHMLLTMRGMSSVFQSKNSFTAFWFTYGSLNLLIDLTIWSIPLRSVFSIMHNLSTRKKILLTLAFTVGMMSWCSSILRITFWRYAVDLASDPPYNGPILTLLGVVESSLAISCVSLATLRPLVVKITKWFNRLRGQPSNKTSGPTSFQSDETPNLPHLGASGSRKTGNKGGFEEHKTLTTVDQELMEWEENVLDIKEPQAVRSYSSMDDDVELGSVVSQASSCPKSPNPATDTQIQVPLPCHHQPQH